jgi:phosphoglycolate phosphatase
VSCGLKNLSQLQLYDRVPKTLKTLQERDCRLGIVTNLPDSIVSPFLKGKKLFDFFETIVPARWGKPLKPNPHGIKTAMSDLGVNANHRVFYAGDTASDFEAATRAGIPFAWASFGYGSIEDFSSIEVLNSFEDILEL